MTTPSPSGPAPVAPRPPKKTPGWRRVWRWLQDHSVIAALVGLLVVIALIALVVVGVQAFAAWQRGQSAPKFETFSATVNPYAGSATPDGLVLGNGSALGCKPGLTTAHLGMKKSSLPQSIAFANGDKVSAEWTTNTVVLTIANDGGLKGKYLAGYYNGEGASQGFIVPAIPENAKRVTLTGVFGKDGAFVGVASARGAVLCTDSVPKS